MRLTGTRAYTRAAPVPKMPPGLVELMEGLTKDVLRNNPSNVYEFCANHLEKLLEIRDGPSSKKSLTLEEKISKAQEKVRQRAKERQEFYDDDEVRNAAGHVSENVDSGKGEDTSQEAIVSNNKAPVHHDLELSLSEVEISHEPTDNSLTFKESIYDEADEIPISKSSTLSSISKSTVIDLISGNDHDTNTKEDTDDGNGNIEVPTLQMHDDEQIKANEVIDDNNYIELPKIEISNDEPAHKDTGSEKVDAQKDEMTIEKNIQPSCDNIDKIQESIESSVTDNSDEQVVKEESESVISITYEENPTEGNDNLTEERSSTTVKNDLENKHKANLKSLVEVNDIVEEAENITTEIDTSSDNSTSKTETGLIVEVNKDSIITEDKKVTTEITNELVPTKSLDNEAENNSSIALSITDNSTEFLNKTIQPEPVNHYPNDVIELETSFESHSKDSDINEILVQIDKTNDSVNVSDAVLGDVKMPIPDPIEKDIIVHASQGVVSTEEKSELFEDTTVDATANKNEHNDNLEEKHIFTVDEETLNKENNVISYSTSFQEPGTVVNNDDSGLMGSDLSKAEDHITRIDNEDGQNKMDLETAAVTIQKVFRSFLFKSGNSTFEDITNDEALEEDNDKNKEEYYAAANLNKERRPLGITRMDTVLQTVNEEKSLSLSTDDSSTLSSAATTIQAHVRGFLVRSRLNSYKTVSTNSLVNSNEMLDTDTELQKNKTILNIHIVPQEGNYLSRDESLITSMELSLDGSPPSSLNLHPLSYDLVSERRKLLKREDAIQSVSPPSNNSGKLSEDSIKEVSVNEDISKTENNMNEKDGQSNPEHNLVETLVTAVPDATLLNEQEDSDIVAESRKRSISSDESDVITPFTASPRSLVGDFENTSKLIHSGEFHDVVLPTKVSRSDTTVVREFKNVLAYILLWNHL